MKKGKIIGDFYMADYGDESILIPIGTEVIVLASIKELTHGRGNRGYVIYIPDIRDATAVAVEFVEVENELPIIE